MRASALARAGAFGAPQPRAALSAAAAEPDTNLNFSTMILYMPIGGRIEYFFNIILLALRSIFRYIIARNENTVLGEFFCR